MEVKIVHGDGDLSDAFLIRDTVFTKEQGFAAPDVDALDPLSVHVVLYEDGHPVATGRCCMEDNGKTGHLGRLCVLKEQRGKDLGRAVITELERLAVQAGAKQLRLGAQLYAIPFYEKCGFVPSGERFFDEFCEHEWMQKSL